MNDLICDHHIDIFCLIETWLQQEDHVGHTLDVQISKGAVISNVDVINVALSNQFCVFFDLSVRVRVQNRDTVYAND